MSVLVISLIIDRKPGGHLIEFAMLKSQDTIIAILRPKAYRSTFMMDSHPLSRLVKAFEFEKVPDESERCDSVG